LRTAQPPGTKPPGRMSEIVLAALIGAGGGIVSAIITGVFSLLARQSRSPNRVPIPTTSATVTPGPTPTPTPQPTNGNPPITFQFLFYIALMVVLIGITYVIFQRFAAKRRSNAFLLAISIFVIILGSVLGLIITR
jgi:hypothetical protein